MKYEITERKHDLSIDANEIADVIAQAQYSNGEIPWCRGQKSDPWDHVEAAMGLSTAGYLAEALRAYEWLAEIQLEDGSWYAAYMEGVPEDKTRETNMTAYIAVGIFHYYLITGDLVFTRKMWPTVKAAIDFVISLQAPGGEIYWAISPNNKTDHMALLTGSSSIYMSIKCALALSNLLGYDMPAWKKAMVKLANAIQNKPQQFNMTKSRFSMDWFYPILSGAITGQEAQARIDKYWKKFVIEDHGVLCVSNEPWVTIAESCELSLALSSIGTFALSEIVFNWICDKTFDDGSYWCGYTCPDMTIWPQDKFTWTNGVVIMAADAIYNLTPAAKLFSHRFWNSSEFSSFNGL
ncbi:MAG: phenyltransferase domain-containing protein [Desulfobacterales bacterium]|nr:phenyltransferase domain-containing protein [Desulfobacterales bacterium]